tara:strand:+ start:111 stop:317 length:207 start_codon:yes stop_codon:yes gene_type:complete
MKIFNFGHLRENEFSYFQHCKRSLVISLYMTIGAITGVIHAFLPFVLWDTASEMTRKLCDLKNFPAKK